MRAQIIDRWYGAVTNNFEKSLLSEMPNMVSVVMERTCNLQCKHCIYGAEESSHAYKKDLKRAVEAVVQELPGAEVLHEGRIILPWHIHFLSEMKKKYKIKVGLIDNGTYLPHIPLFKKEGLHLDWLDISVDGLRESHSLQRDNIHSYDVTIKGLKHAREITKGRVSALFTVTTLNVRDIKDAGEYLLNGLVDEFHITPITAKRKGQEVLEVQDFDEVMEQVNRLQDKYGDRVVLKLFTLQDLKRVCGVDERLFKSAFKDALVGRHAIHMNCKAKFFYYPTSLWPLETFLIDADGYYRQAYCQQYTLRELKQRPEFTVCKIDGSLSLKEMYELCVKKWSRYFLKGYLYKEMAFLREIS